MTDLLGIGEIVQGRQLRPHQDEAMQRLRHSLSAGRLAPMLMAPTGFGKTRVAAEIVKGARRKGKRVLIIVPRTMLIDQTIEELGKEGISDIGVICGLDIRTNWAQPVQVASVQTLQRRKMPDADVILIDEAHEWFQFFETMMAESAAKNIPVIGLSATPWTKGLGKHFDDFIVAATTQGLIDAGYLSKFRVFAPSHPDLSDVRIKAGDYHETDLSGAMNSDTLVADVVATWLQRGEDRPTLCFGVDRAHAKHLQRQFEAAGVATGYIDAHTPKDERAAVRRQFHSGEIKVVCNVACLTTGVDWDVRCVILARPTKSEMRFVQMLGRGLRTAPGKDDLLVLDHSDTHLRLGFITDIRHDELNTGRKAVQEAKKFTPVPKECPQCHYLRPAKVSVCPSCGFKPERQCAVETADGELIEFKRPEKPKADADRKISVYGQLKAIAKSRGYSDGWASHKYREYFGFWPNNYSWAPLVEPTPEILNWEKSRRIAYAKGRGKGDHAVHRA